MLRRLNNAVRLRKLATNESVSIQDAIELLTNLDGFTGVNLKRRDLTSSPNEKNQSPKYITDFISSKFGKTGGEVYAKHQVYAGAGIEKHYIDLEERVGRGLVVEISLTAEIDYEIKK